MHQILAWESRESGDKQTRVELCEHVTFSSKEEGRDGWGSSERAEDGGLILVYAVGGWSLRGRKERKTLLSAIFTRMRVHLGGASRK
jgi:hypothetical protein